MSKTPQMLEFERQHGRPAEQVIADAINEHGSISAAARALGMSHNTLFLWTYRLGIRIKTVAEAGVS